MSQQIINISTPNDGLGDVLRNGFDKTNQNFTELYDGKVDKVTGKGLSENDFTVLDKAKLDGIEAGAEVNVQADWGETDPLSDSFILNKPPSLYSAFGYFHYSDLATQTTPLEFSASTPLQLINDTLGAFTNEDQAPYGISSVWNTSTNALDFSQLSVGDGISIRTDLSISTTSVNQNLRLYIKFGVGTASEYDLLIDSWNEKSVITFKKFIKDVSFSIDNEDWRDAPAKIYILSDDDGGVKVNGWYIPIIRKSINIVDFDDRLLVKKSDAQPFQFLGSGSDAIIPLSPLGGTEIRLQNPALVSIAGFDLSLIIGVPTAEVPYANKPYQIRNLTGNPVIVKNELIAADSPFFLTGGSDLIIPNKESLYVTYDVSGFVEAWRSWDSDIQKYKTITGNTTIDNTFHNCIVYIVANAVLTFPTGLRTDFNFVVDVSNGVSGSLVGAVGVTLSGDGTTFASKAMFSVTTFSANNIRLKGQLV